MDLAPVDLRQALEQPADHGVEFDAAMAEQTQRVVHRAPRLRRRRSHIRLAGVGPGRPEGLDDTRDLSSPVSAFRRISRERERIVGSTSPGRCAISTKSERGGRAPR